MGIVMTQFSGGVETYAVASGEQLVMTNSSGRIRKLAVQVRDGTSRIRVPSLHGDGAGGVTLRSGAVPEFVELEVLAEESVYVTPVGADSDIEWWASRSRQRG
jgi:hypothetical protein